MKTLRANLISTKALKKRLLRESFISEDSEGPRAKTFEPNIIPTKAPTTKVIGDNFISKVRKTKVLGANPMSTKVLQTKVLRDSLI